MKVKELIEELKQCNEEDIVILQKDSEGNGYSPLSSLWEGSYKAEYTWQGRVGLRCLSEEDIKLGYSDEDVVEGENCIVLYPIN